MTPRRFNYMAKKPDKNDTSPEIAQAEERVEAIKAEIAQAMIQRNTLPRSATDEEKAAAADRVEQLQSQHHEAAQHVLAIKREETSKLEREHKEKKHRHKQLKASRRPGAHAEPHQDTAPPPRPTHAHRPMDRAAEDAGMDAANAHDHFLERQQLEEDDKDSAEELAIQRRKAEKKRKKEQAAERRDAKKHEKAKVEAKAEAERLKVEKEERAGIRKHASLQRAEEAKDKKRQQRAERKARQRAAQNAPSSGWFSEALRQLKALFGGRR
jgi:hypothetical protein